MSMEQRQPAAYHALLALTIALSLLAVVTLLPNPGASKPNVLGYRSVCSFAPAASARYAPPFAPIGAAVLLAAIAVVFGVRFGRIQSRFAAVLERVPPAGGEFSGLPDGLRRASASEGDISATVEMRVAEGRVAELRLLDGRNVEASLATRLFEAVIAAQSGSVDAVSGATASSRVLLAAVAAAAAK